jgi:hypothetical protein
MNITAIAVLSSAGRFSLLAIVTRGAPRESYVLMEFIASFVSALTRRATCVCKSTANKVQSREIGTDSHFCEALSIDALSDRR